MPPKRASERKQPHKAAHLSSESLARRARRYLSDLERSNYQPFLATAAEEDKERLAVTEAKRAGPVGGKKGKSTMGVRQLLLYRKNLQTLVEESGIKDLPQGTATYLSAAAPPPSEPKRRFCISCGYWGHYRCQKCGDEYCSIRCGAWHDEFRCGKV